MKNYFTRVFALVILVTFSTIASSKDEKIEIKDQNIDMVAVKGIPWLFEYFIDKKAKLCFAVRGQGITVVPCENIVAGYPELKSVINWVK